MARVEVVEDGEKKIKIVARLMRGRHEDARCHGSRDCCCGECHTACCSIVEISAKKNAATAMQKMIRIQISLALMSRAACQRPR